MKIEEAITLFGYHQRSNQKTRTIQSRAGLENLDKSEGGLK
jgi:hypothetical protein